MIDTHVVSENPLQPVFYLGGKGNLRQQVQHLLTLPDLFLYKMDVYLGLAAGGDSVKQTDILGFKGLMYLVQSILLGGA